MKSETSMRRKTAALLGAAAMLLAATTARAADVPLTGAVTTYDQGGTFAIGTSIDGVLGGSNGWGVSGVAANNGVAQASVFQTTAPLTTDQITVAMLMNLGAQHTVTQYRISATTDGAPTLGGNWTTLTPLSYASGTNMLRDGGAGTLRRSGIGASDVYTGVYSTGGLAGITGFRIEVLPNNSVGAPAGRIGGAANGNFVLSEFMVDDGVNLALGRPVTISGAASFGSQTPELITDGNVNTVAHPNTPAGGVVSYMIDLGRPVEMSQIDLYNRIDCCSNRLSDYVVSLHYDNGGVIGGEVYSAAVRGDDTNSGLGGIDSVTAASGAGTFIGQWIKITGPADVAYSPQIAEVTADGAYLRNFAAGRPVTTSGSTYPGQPASNITDQNLDTISHPAAGQDNFQYTIDLGEVADVFSINVHNREDCCSDRLTQYTVSIHRDIDGVVGEAVWSALIRGDASNSGVGGYDTIQEALDGAGRFTGRWLRITGNTADFNPQIAEVEAFGTTSPVQTEAGIALAALRGDVTPDQVIEHRYTLGNPAAQFSQTSPSLLVGQTVDGNTTSGGWGNGATDGSTNNNVAVWETEMNIAHDGDAILEFIMRFASFADHGLGKFRLSATTADRSLFADGQPNGGLIGPDGIWTVLDNLVLFDSNSGLDLVGGTLDSEGWFLIDDTLNPATDSYLILLRTTLSSITGFRLEIMDDLSLTGGGPGLSNSNGNSVLTEFTASIAFVPAPASLPAGLVMMALLGVRRRRTR